MCPSESVLAQGGIPIMTTVRHAVGLQVRGRNTSWAARPVWCSARRRVFAAGVTPTSLTAVGGGCSDHWESLTAKLIRGEERGRWVLQMKDWYLAGWGIRRIAQALHEAGVPSPEGQEWWTFGTIRDTILNPAHAGLNRVGDGSLVPGDWWEQRYYDETTYQLLLAKGEQRRKTPPATLAAVHFPLVGVLRCGHCGRLLRGRRNQGTANLLYRCNTPLHKRALQCVRNAKPAATVEEAVLGIIAELAAREDIHEIARRQAAEQLHQEDENLLEEIQRLEREVGEVQQHMDRWAALFLSDDIPREQLAHQLQCLQDNKDRLEAALAQARAQLQQRTAREELLHRAAEYLRSFPAVWRQLNPDERRELMQTLVEYAVMTCTENGDTVLRVKVLFADEKEVHIPPLARKTQTGLSLRQLAVLELHHQGLTKDQIARQMGVTHQCIIAHYFVIKRTLGVASLDEAYQRCHEDIERFRPWLPLAGRVQRRRGAGNRDALTETQKQVILLKAQGMHPSTIAQRLGIAISTVYVHLHNIRRAMGARTDREAAQKAIRLGLVEADSTPTLRLSDRECAYLHYALQSHDDEWIARQFGVNISHVASLRTAVCDKLEIPSPAEAPDWVRDEIHRRLNRLPLGPLPNRHRQQSSLGEKTLAVLRLRAEGRSHREIAQELGIALPTIGYHLTRAKKLLGTKTPGAAVQEAKQRALI